MHSDSTSIIKITVKKISRECFVCFQWDLQNWKEQSFNLIIGTEGITQLLKSYFEQSKFKWRHQCHTFAKKGTFLTCPLHFKTTIIFFGFILQFWRSAILLSQTLYPFFQVALCNKSKIGQGPSNHTPLLYELLVLVL